MVTTSGLVLPHVLRRGEQVGVVVNPMTIDDLMFVCKDCRRAYDSGAFEKHGRNCSGSQGDSRYQVLEREMVRYRDLKLRKEEQQVPEEEKSEEKRTTGVKQKKEAKKSPKKSVKKKNNTTKATRLWTREAREQFCGQGEGGTEEEEKEEQAKKKGVGGQKEAKEKQAKKKGERAKKTVMGRETIGTRKSSRKRG